MNRTPDASVPYRAFYAGRRVLVTGGLGFIGSNLSRELVALGAQVTILDALISDYGGNLFNVDGIADRLRLEIADVRDTAVVTAAASRTSATSTRTRSAMPSRLNRLPP